MWEIQVDSDHHPSSPFVFCFKYPNQNSHAAVYSPCPSDTSLSSSPLLPHESNYESQEDSLIEISQGESKDPFVGIINKKNADCSGCIRKTSCFTSSSPDYNNTRETLRKGKISINIIRRKTSHLSLRRKVVDVLISLLLVINCCFPHSCLVSSLLSTPGPNSNGASLKSFQVHSCDGQELTLDCPLNSVISILSANYGAAAVGSREEKMCHSSLPPSPHVKSSSNPMQNYENNCQSNADVSRLIESTCRSKRTCNFSTYSEESFSAINICRGSSFHSDIRYLEISYTCKPTTLSTRVICEGDRLRLSCQKSEDRIVVFAAWFGYLGSSPNSASSLPLLPVSCQKSSSEESTTATSYPMNASDDNTVGSSRGSPQITFTNCRLTQVTNAIMRICQGKRRCSLMAEKSVLSTLTSGNSDYPGLDTTCTVVKLMRQPEMGNHHDLKKLLKSRMMSGKIFYNHLKVQYTCASKNIFKPSSKATRGAQPTLKTSARPATVCKLLPTTSSSSRLKKIHWLLSCFFAWISINFIVWPCLAFT